MSDPVVKVDVNDPALARLDTFQNQMREMSNHSLAKTYLELRQILERHMGKDVDNMPVVHQRVVFARHIYGNVETVLLDGKPVATIEWVPAYHMALVRALEPPKREPEDVRTQFSPGPESDRSLGQPTAKPAQVRKTPPCVAHDGASTEALEQGKDDGEVRKAGPWPVN